MRSVTCTAMCPLTRDVTWKSHVTPHSPCYKILRSLINSYLVLKLIHLYWSWQLSELVWCQLRRQRPRHRYSACNSMMDESRCFILYGNQFLFFVLKKRGICELLCIFYLGRYYDFFSWGDFLKKHSGQRRIDSIGRQIRIWFSCVVYWLHPAFSC